MQAGRELDALIAEQVFGLTITRDWPCCYMPDDGVYEAAMPIFADTEFTQVVMPLQPDTTFSFYNELGPVFSTCEGRKIETVKFYSTDIADAWQVAEKLSALGLSVQVSMQAQRSYCCLAIQKDGRVIGECAGTAPHAICLAALKAVGYKEVL